MKKTQFSENRDDIHKIKHHPTDGLNRIKELQNFLAVSQHGAALLNWASKNNVTIALDEQLGNLMGIYHPLHNQVSLNPHNDDDVLVYILAHELRHAWQSHNGLLATSFSKIENFVMHTRITEGDAVAFQTQVAYELKLSGYDKPWQSTMFKYPESAKKFERSIHRDSNSLVNGKALWSAFEGWFQSSRVINFYDTWSLKHGEYALKNKNRQKKYTFQNKKQNVEACDMQDMNNLKPLGQHIIGSNYMRHSTVHKNPHKFFGRMSDINSHKLRQVKQSINIATNRQKRHIKFGLRF